MKKKATNKKPSIAVVYDHLTTTHGGAELVLKILLDLFPAAPLFTSVYDRQSANWIKSTHIQASFLQSFPFKTLHQIWAPIHPLGFESLDLSKFEIVLSVSSGAAKGILTSPKQLHICYLLTPTRYLFRDDAVHQEYLQSQKIFQIPGVKQLAMPLFRYLERWDKVAAYRPDKVIAISQLIAQRIKKQYQRKADLLLYPPYKPLPAVKTTFSVPYFLSLGRLVSYKKVDLAIKAALEAQKILVVAGNGVHMQRLLETAHCKVYQRKPNQSIEAAFTAAATKNLPIIFMGSCSEQEKSDLLHSAKALIMAGEEDFGLTGLEAASCGTPTITYHTSGIAEVLPETMAVHLKDQTVQGVASVLAQFNDRKYDKFLLKKTAAQYAEQKFKEKLRNTIYHFWQQHSTICP